MARTSFSRYDRYVSNQPVLTPAIINAKGVFRIGTILWVVALVVMGILYLADVAVPGRYPLIAGAGIVLGALGYWWAHRHHLIDDEGFSE